MSMQAGRRDVLAGAALGAVALPLASNAIVYEDKVNLKVKQAPVITIFDERRCESRTDSQQKYKSAGGKESRDENDKMCVKIAWTDIKVSEATAAKKRQEFIGLKATAINVEQISRTDKPYGAGRPDYSASGI